MSRKKDMAAQRRKLRKYQRRHEERHGARDRGYDNRHEQPWRAGCGDMDLLTEAMCNAPGVFLRDDVVAACGWDRLLESLIYCDLEPLTEVAADGRAYHCFATWAANLAVSEREVILAVNWLREHNLIETTDRRDLNGNQDGLVFRLLPLSGMTK